MAKKQDKGSGLGIVGYDAFEFVVGDMERSKRFYTEMMDVPEVARLDEREAASRGEDAAIFAAGKAQCVCVTPRDRGSAADRWLKRHPDGVRRVGFRVRDINTTRGVLTERDGESGRLVPTDPWNVVSPDSQWQMQFGIQVTFGEGR